MDGGHDGDAEVDQAALVAHAESPVLDERGGCGGAVEGEVDALGEQALGNLAEAKRLLAALPNPTEPTDTAFYLQHAVKASEGGVERVHIIPFAVDGALLMEVFTHDGVGTMIADEKLESLREATRQQAMLTEITLAALEQSELPTLLQVLAAGGQDGCQSSWRIQGLRTFRAIAVF